MKYVHKIIIGVVSLASVLAACDKVDVVHSVSDGTTPVLSSSATVIAPTATDSDRAVVTFSWTDPNYATADSTVKYILQFDTTGGNFTHPFSFDITGKLADSLTGYEIDSIVLGYGLSFNVPYHIDVRMVASYANNNDQKISVVLPVTMQAWVTPPKITPPATGTLFIIGDATAENPSWTNSSLLAPVQQFTQIDSVTYGGIFYLTTGGSYVFLPSDVGDWSHKYGGTSATGGTLLVDNAVPGSNTPGPITSGYYMITVSFQNGTYTVTPYTNDFTGNLFIIGDATPENPSWTNSSLLASSGQQFTQLDNGRFQLTIALNNTGSYLFLPTDVGDWSHKYGGTSATGGTLLFDNAVPGSNTPAPAVSGTYTITVNFVTGTYTVVP